MGLRVGFAALDGGRVATMPLRHGVVVAREHPAHPRLQRQERLKTICPLDEDVMLHVLGIDCQLRLMQGVQGLPLAQLKDESLQVLSGMEFRLKHLKNSSIFCIF